VLLIAGALCCLAGALCCMLLLRAGADCCTGADLCIAGALCCLTGALCCIALLLLAGAVYVSLLCVLLIALFVLLAGESTFLTD